ncbi:hypothetical protein DFH28DRAFT_1110702 [Melampsora americana]|nr:hypothetical protein DFH28DRAFT_1110702 [Melampsora americana]
MSFEILYGSSSVDSTDLVGNTLQPTASAHAAQMLLGPAYLGWMLAILIFGVLSCLFFSYVTGPLYLSAFLNAIENYSYGILQSRDYSTLRYPILSDCLATIPQALCALIVQLYLARRATSLVKSKLRKYILQGLLFTLILESWTFSVIQVVLSFHDRQRDTHALKPLTLNLASAIWLWSNAIAEVSVTTVFCLSLHSKLSKSDNQLTNVVLAKLIRLAIYSASITCFVAVGGAICATIAINLQSPAVILSIGFTSILPGLYGIVFIVTLMIREQLRCDLEGGPSAHPELMEQINTNRGGLLDSSIGVTVQPVPSTTRLRNESAHSSPVNFSPPWPKIKSHSPFPGFLNLKAKFLGFCFTRPTTSFNITRRFQRLGSLF